MAARLQQIKDAFSGDDDFFLFHSSIGGAPVLLMGLESLIDVASTKLSLQTYTNTAQEANWTLDELKHVIGEATVRPDPRALVLTIIAGKLLIYFERDDSYVIMEPAPKSLNRAIETPVNENVYMGSLNSFTEDIQSNIGILRKQIPSDNIVIKSYTVGTEEPTKLALTYYEGRTNTGMVRKMMQQIEKNKRQSVDNIQQLAKKMMGLPSWVMISSFNHTELPQEAANFLRNGRAILFVDRLPIALVVPGMFWDIFCLDSDRNLPLPLMIFLRATRLLGACATIVLPGLYVALVSVNPEVLRIEMALSIAQTRLGIPYPAIIEMILMLVILELITEASVRLPKSIGPTITMVGGIILGQAVVQAHLVSNLLIIILAATTIANSTIVGLQQSLALRLSKYLVVVMAAIYGLLGILIGLLLICAYLSSLQTFGIPYTGSMKAKDDHQHG